MEMSVGTIDTIVLLMAVLVLGIFLVQRIFGTATNAIDQIDNEIRNEVQKIFGSDTSRKVAMYPTSQRITIKQGTRDEGFGFFVRNLDPDTESFTFDIISTDTSNCPERISEEVATNYLIGKSGSINDLESGDIYEKLTTFIISETAPLCTIEYQLEVMREDGSRYAGLNLFLTIE